jgi:D-threo-aldose 1-dehydrogenase
MTTPFPTKQVGRTDLHVSVLGLGTGPLGGLYAPVPEDEAIETVHYSLAHGISLFDTAPFYGAGLAERRLGMALRDVPRESYVLSTKVGRLVTPEGGVRFDFSRDGVLRSLSESLERLGLDRVDILHIHDCDDYYRQALDVVFPTLAELRGQGVIRAVGAGLNQWEMLAEFARAADFDCFLLAGRYTLLEQGALDELLPLCAEREIGVFLGGVYNSGILATGARPGAKYDYADAPPEVLEKVRRIEEICARHGVPLHVAAMQFPLAHPAISALLTGARSALEVEANMEALWAPIPADLWEELRAEGLLHEEAPVPTS